MGDTANTVPPLSGGGSSTSAWTGDGSGEGVLHLLRSFAEAHPAWWQVIVVATIVAIALVAMLVMRKVVLPLLKTITSKTKMGWDDVLLETKVFNHASWILVGLVVHLGAQLTPGIRDEVAAWTMRVSQAFMVFFGTMTAVAMLSAVNELYLRRASAAKLPIKGYVQLVQILVFIFGGILTIATLMQRSPWAFLTGLGALTAVLLLIFKDTILSLVASIQLAGNRMVRIGDWIEMPQYHADGDVIDISLHTVKVQNWDKTISTIPTSKLIESSFKNWRGMSEAGGRRIARNIRLDLGSIRFLDEADIERFGRFKLLEDYIADKQAALAASNQDLPAGITANARRLTNVGTFRAYVTAYLRAHEGIHQEGLTFLIRQLQPDGQGLPLQIYVFTRTTNWVEYEGIQADIFDHLLAILPEFGLRAFQEPTGADFGALAARSG